MSRGTFRGLRILLLLLLLAVVGVLVVGLRLCRSSRY